MTQATTGAPRRRGRRRVLWVVLGLAVLGVGAAVAWRAAQGPPATATLVEPLARGTFVREVTGTGVIEPVQERALAFAVGGTVAEVLVAEGATVPAGETLARLDTAALERDSTTVRTSLASARADRDRLGPQLGVDRLDAEAAVASADDQRARAARIVDDAQRDLSVAQRLLDAGAASRDEVRAAEGALDAASRDLTQAELSLRTARTRLANLDQQAAAQRAAAAAQVGQLEANLADLEARLQDTAITAPFDGVITSVSVKSGDLVGTQPVLSVADTSDLQVRARFDENRAADLVAGQPAEIVPDADTRRRLQATVVRISPVAVREGGAAQVTADLTFAPDEPLDAAYARPGSTVTVRVRVSVIPDTLLVPLEAITEAADASYVYRVDPSEDGGVARRVDVAVRDRNATIAAVDADLAAGDLLALINVDALADGAAVAFPPVDRGADAGGD